MACGSVSACAEWVRAFTSRASSAWWAVRACWRRFYMPSFSSQSLLLSGQFLHTFLTGASAADLRRFLPSSSPAEVQLLPLLVDLFLACGAVAAVAALVGGLTTRATYVLNLLLAASGLGRPIALPGQDARPSSSTLTQARPALDRVQSRLPMEPHEEHLRVADNAASRIAGQPRDQQPDLVNAVTKFCSSSSPP